MKFIRTDSKSNQLVNKQPLNQMRRIKPLDYEKEKVSIERLSHLLDDQFKIPGTSIGFGFDSIVGLIPVVGDTLSMSMSFYILHLARRFGVPKGKQFKMVLNIGKDYFLGLVPLIGDLLDIASKANLKNLRIIQEHIASITPDLPMDQISNEEQPLETKAESRKV